MMGKKVIIIGVGPCGLAALKEQLEAGHDAIAIEASAHLGGVFASKTAYSGLRLTISNWLMAFSDFPDPSRLHYPTGQHYLDYLHAYAKHFELEKHITYNARVMRVHLSDAGKWQLDVFYGQRQETVSMEADALIVATGANQTPREPPASLANFSGRMFHSIDYSETLKNEVKEKQLRVLVVGGGESGADMTAELCDLSPNNITVWLRRHIVIGPRFPNPLPEIPQVLANVDKDFPANAFLEAATTNRMSAGQNIWFYGFFRRVLWNTPFVMRTMAQMCLDGTREAWFANDQASVPTKNQRMSEAIEEGKLKAIVCPKVTAVGKTVSFHHKNGKTETADFDLILLCTGFQVQFPWLKIDNFDPNPRSWWLHCFPPGLGDNLFFVGFARPHQGGIPACGEMLSRYIALILRGDREVPANYARLAEHDAANERERYFLRPDLNTLVDYNSLMESVARRIGCEPKISSIDVGLFNLHMFSLPLMTFNLRAGLAFWTATIAAFILRNDGFLVKYWLFPHWSVWYRTHGPGANPALLHNTLAKVPLSKSIAIDERFGLFLLWSVGTFYVQRILSLPMFVVDRVLGWTGVRNGKMQGGWLRPKMFGLHSCEWRVGDLVLP